MMSGREDLFDAGLPGVLDSTSLDNASFCASRRPTANRGLGLVRQGPFLAVSRAWPEQQGPRIPLRVPGDGHEDDE